MAEVPHHAEILELGCGTGANFSLYPRSKLAVSTELSSKMIRIAAGKGHSSVLLMADAQELPFPANSFDAAFATLVFCSIPDPNKALAELRRVLKPGGTVILLEHVRPPGPLGRIFDLLNYVTSSLFEDHFNRETAKIVEMAGFDIIEVRKKARGIVNLIICGNRH